MTRVEEPERGRKGREGIRGRKAGREKERGVKMKLEEKTVKGGRNKKTQEIKIQNKKSNQQESWKHTDDKTKKRNKLIYK